MTRRIAKALCVALIGAGSAAIAQMPTVPLGPPPGGTPPPVIVRPLGSVPLMIPSEADMSPKPCDVACLTGLAKDYMAALAKQDGSKLPWAQRVRYAENGVTIMVGDGTWAGVNAHGASPLIIADEKAGKAVWIGSANEHGQPGFYAIELTARGGRIRGEDSLS